MGGSEQFGVRLRREREKRGITLPELAAATKVSVDLWVGLERNDLSRWPAGIFARAFVRDYARVIGLDAEAVVDEFCRQFSIADRRTSRIVQAQAALIGHTVEGVETAEPLPAGRDRRNSRRPEPHPAKAPIIYAPRMVAAALDVACICGLGVLAVRTFEAGFLESVGLLAVCYFTAATILSGVTPGTSMVAVLRHHAPSLFTSRRPVSA